MASTQILNTRLVLAPADRLWTALTDADQLATWFGAEFGSSFVPGAHVLGHMVPTRVLPPVARRRKAYTGFPLELEVERAEPPKLLSFRWSPLAFFNPELWAVGTSLVIIEIEPHSRGSRMTIRTSGVEGIDSDQLERANEANAAGWSTQVRQLELFLSGAIDLRPVKD